MDWDAFTAAIRERTRLFLLCNPHNPVGHVFDRGELLRMAEICLGRGLVICADEIHCELVYPGHAHVPIASLDPEIERQTITLMAPSKTFNDGAAFGRPGGGFVRLNFGYPRSILADALDRMRRALVESS